MVDVLAKAPSNIALIKYMGKRDPSRNLPANPSLSMTLDAFCTFAEVSGMEPAASPQERCRVHWIAEKPKRLGESDRNPWQLPELTESANRKVEALAARLSQRLPPLFSRYDLEFQPLHSFELRTVNTFPAAAGLASSASAFAAMTLAVSVALCRDRDRIGSLFGSDERFRKELAALSREGSGSSCRSFLGPWVLWKEEEIHLVPSELDPLSDLVLVVKSAPKKVSSSEAHRLVTSSPAWPHRTERASLRCEALAAALKAADLGRIAELSWSDCWEMHQLFHTAHPPFTYWEPETLKILKWFMEATSDFPTIPVVTLDAGANVHVLVPKVAKPLWRGLLDRAFPGLTVLEDAQGRGAEILHA